MDAFSIAAIAVMVATLALGMLKRFSLTLMLLIGNLVVFMIEVLGPSSTIMSELGFRPIYLQTFEGLYTIFTSMFVHLGIYHIFANMLFLYLFGLPLEERIGKYKVLVIYLAAGIIGLMLQAAVMWGSYALVIGASGAISGLVGALFILYPRDKLTLPLFFIILPRTFEGQYRISFMLLESLLFVLMVPYIFYYAWYENRLRKLERLYFILFEEVSLRGNK